LVHGHAVGASCRRFHAAGQEPLQWRRGATSGGQARRPRPLGLAARRPSGQPETKDQSM
jgi:hypothetical protein